MRICEDLSKYSWSIFKNLLSNADRIDIVFDVYLETSIKQQERNRCGRKCPIVETKINSISQNLPVKLDKFWGSSNNKMKLEKVFITWLRNAYSGEKPVYLGDAIPDNVTSCVKVCEGHTSSQGLPKCFQKKLMIACWFKSTMLCESRIFGKSLLLLQTPMYLLIWFTNSYT